MHHQQDSKCLAGEERLEKTNTTQDSERITEEDSKHNDSKRITVFFVLLFCCLSD